MKGNFYENERVALFIDGANLYSAARALGFDIDYRRLLKVFREKGRLVRAYYYTALVEDQEYSPIRPLIDWLDYNGYTMVTKPTKEFTDAMGRRKVKGNMDIELAIDVLEMAEHLDHVILFSGDGDFRRLVEAVQRRGLRVSVVSTINEGAAVRFTVSDRGPGVPDAEKKSIFEKFATGGRKDAALETGTGIGLSFCRAAVAAHKGRLGGGPPRRREPFRRRAPSDGLRRGNIAP